MRVLLLAIFQLAVLTTVAPCLAQAPGAGNAVLQAETAYWESVKDSQDPAELQSYLDKYPNGTFSGLAKIRLDRLKKKPAESPAGPAAAASPEPNSASAYDPLPKAGDTWTYAYTDLWKPGERSTISYTAKSVSEGRILDARSGPKGSDEFPYTTQPILTQRAGGAYEFSPYYFTALSLMSTQSFRTKYKAPDHYSPWNVRVSFAGAERVSVPAGSFDAIKVQLDGNRQVNDIRATYPTRMKQTIWYSKQVKRVVKITLQTETSVAGPSDREVYELVSYTLK